MIDSGSETGRKRTARCGLSLPHRGLGRTILLSFLAISLVPLAVVSALNYLNADRSLRKSVQESLAAVAEIKTQYIHSHFKRLLTDLRAQSESAANVAFLEALRAAHHESGKSAREFARSYEWENLVHDNAGDLKTFTRLHGFSDVLLIDAEGNVLFSVMREDDLGSNLFRGRYSDTLFASACRRSLDSGRPLFSDFESYAPSSGAVAGFVVAPLVNEDGDKTGILGLQVPIDRIDRIMQVSTGLGKTGESYLIGADLSMRSNSARTDGATILRDPIDTEQTRLWLREHGGTKRPINCKRALLLDYRGYRGARVIGTHNTVEVAGVRMGVIAEIEASEAFAPITRQRNTALAVGLVALLVVIASALFVAQSIVHPIHALHEGTEVIGRGDFEHRVGTDANDEIGQLSRAFDDMVDRLKTVTASRDDLDREVAQRERAEGELRDTLADLERSNQDLEQFAYAASHDLQEPLRKVLAFGSLLEQECGDKLEGDERQYMDRMLNATRRMRTLITDLLMYSRVATRGKTFASVDMNETVRGVLSDLETRIGETGATVDVADLPVIEADPTQMRQLMQNLIGNALKFHRDGELPHVKVYADAGVTGGGDTPESHCRIVVEDNGIGFEAKFVERIFGVFQRLHGRHEYSGSGIGLAVCRRIAERHGGTIAAEGKPGEGSTFTVTLPLKQAEKGEPGKDG